MKRKEVPPSTMPTPATPISQSATVCTQIWNNESTNRLQGVMKEQHNTIFDLLFSVELQARGAPAANITAYHVRSRISLLLPYDRLA